MARLEPSRLGSILTLEAQRGYADVAVLGGLDRYLAHWAQDMGKTNGFPWPGPSYAALKPSDRRDWAQQALAWLAQTSTSQDQSQTSVDLAATASSSAAPLKTTGTSAHKTGASTALSPKDAGLDTPLRTLRGIGPGVARRLEGLGVTTVRDALFFFPRRHLDYSQRKQVRGLVPGQDQTVIGVLWEAHEAKLGPRLRGTEAVLGDETGNVRAVWFNQPQLWRSLPPQAHIAVSGRVNLFRHKLVFESPEYEVLGEDEEDLIHTGRLIPVYPLTEGLHARTVRRIIKPLVDRFASELPETLPEAIRSRRDLLALPEAIRQAHYPESEEDKARARLRLAFEELFQIQLAVLVRRRAWREEPGPPLLVNQAWLAGFIGGLPFALTGAQERALGEILEDMAGPKPMGRLLQGEVGSGKTVVATAALLMAVANGYQGAIMAPTEVLAEQHYQTLCLFLGQAAAQPPEPRLSPAFVSGRGPLVIALLKGSLSPEQKNTVREEVAAGKVDLLIGTHALIQDGAEFARLGLVVIDEQHRFGVMQRAALRQKGARPHLLVMSATPIPRTLALTLYGELDISLIDELPPGRQAVETRWLPPRQRRTAFDSLRDQVRQGRQGFVICPLIQESPLLEVKAATTEHARLSREVFPELRLGLLHGRMPTAEKDQVMRAFRDGDLDILVSTPVVEVGIDVPNATVMLIEGADRFGLSQLHQFRGRVGRGQHQSFCWLLADTPSAEARERLAILERVRDGFVLAEEDLRMRKEGDVFGTRQSGLPELRMAQLSDLELLEAARQEAQLLLQEDPNLERPEHRPLAQAVASLSLEVAEPS